MWLSELWDGNKLRVKGQAGVRKDYKTIDHIFTLRVIIEEAK
jgi:hypothetical protein